MIKIFDKFGYEFHMENGCKREYEYSYLIIQNIKNKVSNFQINQSLFEESNYYKRYNYIF